MVTYAREPVQVYLREDQMQALEALAQESGESVTTLVQRGVDVIIDNLSHVTPPTPSESDVAIQARDEEAIRRPTGMFSSDLPDLSIEHDRYLAEFVDENNRTWRLKPPSDTSTHRMATLPITSNDQPTDDPFRDLIGLIDSGVDDLSINHDRYIVEILEEEQRRWQAQSS